MEREKTATHLKQSPTRCPYCHEEALADGSVVCQDCLARHHEGCWKESGACSSCASVRSLTPGRGPPLTREVALRILSERGYSAEQIETLFAPAFSTPELLLRRLGVPVGIFFLVTFLVAVPGGILVEALLHGPVEDLAIIATVGIGILLGFVAMLVSLRR